MGLLSGQVELFMVPEGIAGHLVDVEAAGQGAAVQFNAVQSRGHLIINQSANRLTEEVVQL